MKNSQNPERLAGDDGATPDSSYDEILKSSILIGGSGMIATVIAVVRTKILAMLLGPSGFGLISVYQSIADLARSIAELGINNSGVRQIAQAVATRDELKIARTITVLRRISVILGSLGALMVLVLCAPISWLSFGSGGHAGAIALLSLAVFFRLISDAQIALIQGLRRIRELAKIGIIGAALGALVSIPIVYLLGEAGIVPSLVAVAILGCTTSWWFSRKVRIVSPSLTTRDVRDEATALLKLGFAFMTNGFFTMGAAFAARTIVVRVEGLDNAGFYQAAMTLGSLYCAYVYQGVFADFYPRLVGAANNNEHASNLVNQQTHLTMLMTAPGVVVTVAFAPIAIALFYSAEFNQAVDVLRWICLGAALRVVFQPLGFIVVAKGRQVTFFFTEFACAIANVTLTWVCVRAYGLEGAGIAFFLSYVVYGLIMYPVGRSLVGFKWSSSNRRTALVLSALVVASFGMSLTFPEHVVMALGTLATLISGVYAVRELLDNVSVNKLPSAARWLIARLPFLQRKTPK
ncbi:MAG: O-antigen translocase [Burkholderiales bacterium]